MNHFRGIRFKGTFRSYQQRILDNAKRYLEDGKINIVAAPGSGKTVLGLELIRRLEEPCLILSPTTAIREQWGQRFKTLFLEKEDRFEELFSTDLHQPKLINSITYQALYMAMERVSETQEDEIDCSDIDLFKTLRKSGIKTICLDEAHHLKKEWQKALEKFLKRLDGGMARICLTATPPYDAERTEWTRYYDICGEIDEEIFVPELVAHGDLCPHQDYVYFNYPSAKEEQAFREHKQQVQAVLEEVKELECIQRVADVINKWDATYYHKKEMSRTYAHELEALLVLLEYYGKLDSRKSVRSVLGRKSLPAPEEKYFEKALQFLLDSGNKFQLSDEQAEELIRVLRKHQVYQRKRVRLTLTEVLRKKLISSVGKLKSIEEIAIHEYRTLGKDLRMLILADYNQGTRENLRKIGTTEPFHEISVVSIFETLRRLGETWKIGVLSGSLMFLPVDLVPQGTMVKAEPLGNTGYASLEMYGSNRDRMELVGELFRSGRLQVLIGTKALLGEGWDEPCINTLILASFVGTFVSSNQMRGRAIRVNPNDPGKTANIWHLVTLEPDEVVKETALERLKAATEEQRETLQGCDYEVVKQRFETFMAPHYETGEIRSGMDRLNLIRPPFDANGILRINREMLEVSSDRAGMSRMWKNQLVVNSYQVVMETKLPLANRLPSFGYLLRQCVITCGLGLLVGGLLIFFLVILLLSAVFDAEGIIGKVCSFVFTGIIVAPLAGIMVLGNKEIFYSARDYTNCLWRNRAPILELESMGQTLVKTLTECKIIEKGATVKVVKKADSDNRVSIYLQNASMYDQKVFSTALREMVAPIEKPRYLLVPKKGSQKEKHKHALACPYVIGKTKEFVRILEKYLKENWGIFEAVYTGSEKGQKLLYDCRNAQFQKMYIDVEEELPLLEADTKYIVVKKEPSLLLEDKGEKEKNG